MRIAVYLPLSSRWWWLAEVVPLLRRVCSHTGIICVTMLPNNRVEHAHGVCSTRKGDAPLLAAHAGRWAIKGIRLEEMR